MIKPAIINCLTLQSTDDDLRRIHPGHAKASMEACGIWLLLVSFMNKSAFDNNVRELFNDLKDLFLRLLELGHEPADIEALIAEFAAVEYTIGVRF